MDEMVKRLEKLEYQMSLVSEAIDYDKNPVVALVLGCNWGPEVLGQVHDIFQKWDERLESGGSLSIGEFEADFRDNLDISYQGLKPIVNALYDNGQWTTVCEAYVDAFNGSPPVEYHSIMRRER